MALGAKESLPFIKFLRISLFCPILDVWNALKLLKNNVILISSVFMIPNYLKSRTPGRVADYRVYGNGRMDLLSSFSI